MIISLNSIELIIEGSRDRIQEIIENKLVFCGFEIDNIQIIKPNFQNLIIGKLISLEKIDNSDKLQLCQVFDGSNNIQIVCGGKGLIINKNYILAPVGSKVGALDIKERKVFNTLSQGMLCGWEEINGNFPGMTLVDDDFIPGTPIENLYNINYFDDIIYDIKITPNRPDCLSLMGLAREIIIHDDALKLIKKPNKFFKNNINNSLDITIESDNCLGFYTTIIDNHRIDSPLWLKLILQNLGFKSINFPVDLSNFLCIKWGYPSHIHNFNQWQNTVIMEDKGEFLGLNDEKYLLNDSLVLKQNNNIAALLGIIGAKDYGYHGGKFIWELGVFNHQKIYKTIKNLKIFTHAGYIFSRWVDTIIIPGIIHDFIEYLLDYSPNLTFSNTIIHKNITENNNKFFTFTYEEWFKIGGYPLSIEKQRNILNQLGFVNELWKPTDESDNYNLGIKATVPHWRVFDINHRYNLIEEILRINGVNQYKIIELNNNKYQKSNGIFLDQYLWCQNLVHLNYQEILTNSVDMFNKYPGGVNIKEMNYQLKNHYVYDLINIANEYSHKGFNKFNIFTLNTAFFQDKELPYSCGLKYNKDVSKQSLWHQGQKDIEKIIVNKGGLMKYLQWEITHNNLYNSHQNVNIFYKNKIIGIMGFINYKINPSSFLIWEIYSIDEITTDVLTYEGELRSIDVSFVYDGNINDLIDLIYKNFSIYQINIMDIYKMEENLEEKTSYTLEIQWSSSLLMDKMAMNNNISDFLMNNGCILRK